MITKLLHSIIALHVYDEISLYHSLFRELSTFNCCGIFSEKNVINSIKCYHGDITEMQFIALSP